jgi:hypothetical protein
MFPSLHNINMGRNPWLIIYNGHFIVRNKDESSLSHCQTSRSKHKIMHGVIHAPISNVSSMFSKVVQHFEETKNLLQPLKSIINHFCFNRWKIVTNYTNLFYAFYRSQFVICWAIKACPWKVAYYCLFLTCWVNKLMKYSLTATPSHTHVVLRWPTCFHNPSSLGISNFFIFIWLQIVHVTWVILP